MAVDVGSAVGYLDLDISGFLSGLRSAQTEAEKASGNLATKLGGNLTSAGKSLTTAGSTLTKTVTLPIVGAGAAMVKVTSDFESGMSKVAAISGATGDDLVALTEKAKEMGAKTKFSATESAEAFTYMAMAGWKTEDMLAGIDGIMALSAADGLDLATTSDIVTDALTAFGLSASDSGHFADVLAKASSSANTNVSMLGESFKYVAPVAGSLGYSAEDTAIALGLMANAGIKGSQGGTALRGSLTRLVKPTDDAAAMMEKYGLSLTNTDGTMKPLIEVMGMLRTNLGDLTEAEQAQVAATLFGKEAMSGMLAIINASDTDFSNLTDQIYNADGAAQKMADTMLDNLGGQITILKSALEGLAIQFGEIILPYLKEFVAWLQNLVQKFQELSPEQKEQVVKWAAIAAAIGPVLLIVGKLVTSVGGMITTFGKIPGALTKVKGSLTVVKTGLMNMKEGFTVAKAGFGGLATQAGGFGTKIGAMAAGITGPMLLIVAAVALVVGAFVSLWQSNEEFRNKIMAIWNQIVETFNGFFQGIVDRLNALGFNFESITDVIKAIWDAFCNFLAPIFTGVFQQIADAFQFVTNTILGVMDFFIGLFTGNWEQCWNGISGIFVGIWEFIKSTFENVLNMIVGIFDTVLGWFGTSWEGCWNGISNFFIGIWNGIAGFFQGLWDGIVSIVQWAWDSQMAILSTIGTWIYDNIIAPVAEFFVGLWNGIVNAYHTVIDPWIEIFTRLAAIVHENIILPIQEFFVNLWNSITSGLQAAWDWVVGLLSTVAGWVDTYVVQPVVGFFTSLWETVSNAASSCWDAIVGVWQAVSGWFDSTIIQPVVGFFTGMWDGLKNGAAAAWEGIKSVFSTVANFFKDIFSKAWQGVVSVFSTAGQIFNNIVDGIITVFKMVVNGIIDGINWVVAKPFEGLNGILSTLQGISILGVQPFGWLSWRAPIPQIPHLAKGAVLPPNSPFLAVVGDQKRGVNVEAPLSTIQEAVAVVIKSFAYKIIELQKVAIGILAQGQEDLGYITYNGFKQQKEFRNGAGGNKRNEPGNGDTFIFNSPKPISEIEAARQMKRAKRDLAEGF